MLLPISELVCLQVIYLMKRTPGVAFSTHGMEGEVSL